MMSLVATLFITHANAGILAKSCLQYLSRAIVQDDPTQFNDIPTEYLTKELDRLTIRLNWNKATYQDRQMIIIIENELKFRSLFK